MRIGKNSNQNTITQNFNPILIWDIDFYRFFAETKKSEDYGNFNGRYFYSGLSGDSS